MLITYKHGCLLDNACSAINTRLWVTMTCEEKWRFSIVGVWKGFPYTQNTNPATLSHTKKNIRHMPLSRQVAMKTHSIKQRESTIVQRRRKEKGRKNLIFGSHRLSRSPSSHIQTSRAPSRSGPPIGDSPGTSSARDVDINRTRLHT